MRQSESAVDAAFAVAGPAGGSCGHVRQAPSCAYVFCGHTYSGSAYLSEKIPTALKSHKTVVSYWSLAVELEVLAEAAPREAGSVALSV